MGSTQLAVNEKGPRTLVVLVTIEEKHYVRVENLKLSSGHGPSTHVFMHGLGPNVPPAHDHGAALDAASHGQYHPPAAVSNSSPGTKLIHSLVDALSNRASKPSTAEGFDSLSGSGTPERMPEVSDLVELKNRLCLREGLNHDECERALLPTLEHASMVHSHIHHLTDQSEEAFVQTRNAIVYISLVVVVYVIVVLWLVSANFRSSLAAMASNSSRNVMGQLVGPLPHLRDDGELESLIVVRDRGSGKKGKAKCTTELDHEDDGDYV